MGIRVFVCMWGWVGAPIYLSINLSMYTSICFSINQSLDLSRHMFVCMYVCMYVFMYVCAEGEGCKGVFPPPSSAFWSSLLIFLLMVSSLSVRGSATSERALLVATAYSIRHRYLMRTSLHLLRIPSNISRPSLAKCWSTNRLKYGPSTRCRFFTNLSSQILNTTFIFSNSSGAAGYPG